jgi:hypothetical protein
MIICMSSVHDVMPWAGPAHYAASKAGVVMLKATAFNSDYVASTRRDHRRSKTAASAGPTQWDVSISEKWEESAL